MEIDNPFKFARDSITERLKGYQQRQEEEKQKALLQSPVWSGDISTIVSWDQPINKCKRELEVLAELEREWATKLKQQVEVIILQSDGRDN